MEKISNTKNNKIIAKNTIYLYIRSAIVLVITLYTSRLTLKYLGIEDYGLYNVVGGVVALFAFLRSSLTKGTQRFLNVEMVRSDGNLNETFCVSMNIHIVIAICTLILSESIGLWILNTYIQIPEGREFAANVVFQVTIFSLLSTIISVPYSADIISHERMGFFAVVSILDAILRLLISFLIVYGDDRLILYAILMSVVSFLNLFLYYWYCRLHFEESRYKLYHNKTLTKSMLDYTSWTVVGQFVIVGTNQGNNILMNIFHSVAANAAMGVAHQVNAAVVTLTSNFQTAFNPQITKSYALRDYKYLKKLVYITSKISFVLLITASLPIMFNMNLILNIWLEEVPPYAAEFCILVICDTILNAIGAPFNFTVLSSGKIKWFQIITSITFLSDLVILYPLYLIGFPAVTALVCKTGTMIAVTIVRVFFAHRVVDVMETSSFMKQVLFPMLLSTTFMVSFGFWVNRYAENLWSIIMVTILMIIFSILCNLFITFTSPERVMLVNFAKSLKNRFNKH